MCAPNVVVNYRSSQKGAYGAVDAIEDAGRDAVAVQANVVNPDEAQWVYGTVHSACGTSEVLVNNAGSTVGREFENVARDDRDRVMPVNPGGVFTRTGVRFEGIRQVRFRTRCRRVVSLDDGDRNR